MHRPTFAWLSCALLAFAAACGNDGPTFNDAPRDADNTDAAPGGMLPSSLDLGLGDCGGSATRTFAVMNTGQGDLTYAFTLSDAIFSVTPASGTILKGTSTTFTVTANVPASATAAQALTAMLTATTNLPSSPINIPVSVTPRGADIVFSPPAISFGQVPVNGNSMINFSATNMGNLNASVAIAAPGGEFTRTFGAGGSATIGPLASLNGSFRYAPTDLGIDNGSATVTVTGTTCGTQPTTIDVSGEGMLSGGVLVQGSPVNFNTVNCGAGSGTANVTLMNTSQIVASFTAGFLTDPEGDDALYSVSPPSGSVPIGGSITLMVTRQAITIPATPRAYDATLHLTTTLATTTTTDVPVRQTLRGPVLTVTPTSRDFGFAPVGVVQSSQLTLNNIGTAPATISGSVAAPFHLALPAMLPAGISGVGTATYQPAALGQASGTATITVAGSCALPVTLTFDAGFGPYAQIANVAASADCPVGASITTQLTVDNPGNQPLTIACVESGTSDLAPMFNPTMLTVAPGGTEAFDLSMSTGATVHAGTTSTTLLCTDNEPLTSTRTVGLMRSLHGGDLVLAAPLSLDFTCGQNEALDYTIANNGDTSVLPVPFTNLVFPLANMFNAVQHGVGQTISHQVVNGAVQQHGIPDPCAGSGAPDQVVFTGSIGVQTGSGGGNVCSVSPSTLPVTLRLPSATAH